MYITIKGTAGYPIAFENYARSPEVNTTILGALSIVAGATSLSSRRRPDI
jgi:hypothetical protein